MGAWATDLGRPLKTSVHTQNINGKDENDDPMENPYNAMNHYAHRLKTVNLCAKTGID
jgi:hypothetical protein